MGQSARFGVVGILAISIDAGVLALALRAGLGAYAARGLSLAVMMVCAWWLNRTLTFRTTAAPSWAEFARYALAALSGLLLNYALYALAVRLTGLVWLGLALGSAAAAVFNFTRFRQILAPR